VSGSPWLRGYKEASEYARLRDKRHRKLKEWMADGLKYAQVGGEVYFKCEWMDEYIERNGQASTNLHPKTEEVLRKD
jgi:hypothetical protein